LTFISPPALREVQARRAYVLLLFFYFLNIFIDFCQTSYLIIYWTDLHRQGGYQKQQNFVAVGYFWLIQKTSSYSDFVVVGHKVFW